MGVCVRLLVLAARVTAQLLCKPLDQNRNPLMTRRGRVHRRKTALQTNRFSIQAQETDRPGKGRRELMETDKRQADGTNGTGLNQTQRL